MAKIVINIDGGKIWSVHSDCPCEVVVVDCDKQTIKYIVAYIPENPDEIKDYFTLANDTK